MYLAVAVPIVTESFNSRAPTIGGYYHKQTGIILGNGSNHCLAGYIRLSSPTVSPGSEKYILVFRMQQIFRPGTHPLDCQYRFVGSAAGPICDVSDSETIHHTNVQTVRTTAQIIGCRHFQTIGPLLLRRENIQGVCRHFYSIQIPLQTGMGTVYNICTQTHLLTGQHRLFPRQIQNRHFCRHRIRSHRPGGFRAIPSLWQYRLIFSALRTSSHSRRQTKNGYIKQMLLHNLFIS